MIFLCYCYLCLWLILKSIKILKKIWKILILIWLYLGSQISFRKVFVLQTKLWIPPFQWIMSLSSMFVAGKITQKLRCIFVRFLFGHPLFPSPIPGVDILAKNELKIRRNTLFCFIIYFVCNFWYTKAFLKLFSHVIYILYTF